MFSKQKYSTIFPDNFIHNNCDYYSQKPSVMFFFFFFTSCCSYFLCHGGKQDVLA